MTKSPAMEDVVIRALNLRLAAIDAESEELNTERTELLRAIKAHSPLGYTASGQPTVVPAMERTPESSKPKRKITAAGRKKIAAAQKARWTRLKGAKEGKKAGKILTAAA
jgi:hypothetical protein